MLFLLALSVSLIPGKHVLTVASTSTCIRNILNFMKLIDSFEMSVVVLLLCLLDGAEQNQARLLQLLSEKLGLCAV